MTPVLNASFLRKFVGLAGDRLSGNWLLLGGTLLPAVGLDIRSTVDIDIVQVDSSTNESRLQLLQLADELGLPVDAVNSAADFFLRKIEYSERDLIELHKGRKAVIYRPSVQLYWSLKVARLTETDMEDCLAYLEFCRAVGDPIDLTQLLELKVPANSSPEKHSRLRNLQTHLKSLR